MKKHTCITCGKKYTKNLSENAYVNNNCYECSFWTKKIHMSPENEQRRVIINGQHYMIGNPNSAPFRGFEGRKFTIVFHDGRIVKTSCLWHQGAIPERFKQVLIDNAEFKNKK